MLCCLQRKPPNWRMMCQADSLLVLILVLDVELIQGKHLTEKALLTPQTFIC